MNVVDMFACEDSVIECKQDTFAFPQYMSVRPQVHFEKLGKQKDGWAAICLLAMCRFNQFPLLCSAPLISAMFRFAPFARIACLDCFVFDHFHACSPMRLLQAIQPQPTILHGRCHAWRVEKRIIRSARNRPQTPKQV